MLRVCVAGFLGAVVYFVWGMAAWMALPLHAPTIAGLPDEAGVTDLLIQQGLPTGVYVAPWSDDVADWEDPESDWSKKHATGPLYSIYFQKSGGNPMSPQIMGQGFVIDLLSATLAAALLSCAAGGCCSNYCRRLGFVTGLGVFVALIGHASYWNWMHFPADYTIAFMADVIIGWSLAGLVIAAIVRPVGTASATQGN